MSADDGDELMSRMNRLGSRLAAYDRKQTRIMEGLEDLVPVTRGDTGHVGLPVNQLRGQMEYVSERLDSQGEALQEIVSSSRRLLLSFEKLSASSVPSRGSGRVAAAERPTHGSAGAWHAPATERPASSLSSGAGGAAGSGGSCLQKHVLLKDMVGEGGEAASCSICLEDLCAGAEVCTLLACAHTFHFPCIGQWVHRQGGEAKGSCPLCKSDVLPQQRRRIDGANEPARRVAVGVGGQAASTRGTSSLLVRPGSPVHRAAASRGPTPRGAARGAGERERRGSQRGSGAQVLHFPRSTLES